MILKDRIDDIVLVSDDEIKRAMKMLLELAGQVAEPAGAAAIAAAYKVREKLQGEKVIVMVTGGNVSPELLREITNMKPW